MKFTKTQINVMALLGCLIVLMLGGVFLLRLIPSARPVDVPPLPAHEKQRLARPSLNAYIDKEINIGGTGDESAQAVFSYNGKLYVLGSTASGDLDMDGVGGVFMCRLFDRGTEQFFQYGRTGDALVKALVCEGGFLLAVNRGDGSGSALLRIGFDGAAVSETDTSGLYKETFADLKSYAGRYVAVMKMTNRSTENVNLKARIFDESVSEIAQREFPRSYTTEYIDMFETTDGGYVIAANMVSPILNRLIMIKFGLNQQGLFYDVDVTGSGNYRCDGIVPYDYGYVAVIVEETMVCDIITLTADFRLHSRVYLKQSAVRRARLLYAPDGYYCLLGRGLDASTMLVLDHNLQYDKVAAEFSAVSDVCGTYIYRDSTLFACEGQRNIQLISYSGRALIQEAAYGGTGMSGVLTAKLGSKFVTVCTAAAATSDCDGNFGGKDVWIAYLK